MNRDTNQLARGFLKEGVEKGDRLIFYIELSLIAVVAHIVLQKLGVVAVSLSPGVRKVEMEYLLKEADALSMLTEPDRQALINQISPNLKTIAVST